MQLALSELESRGTLGYEVYAPPYICSYAVHAFNIMNQGRKVYWESKALPNMRMHIIFVAPPGYMKTYYLRQMGMDDYSIFGSCKFTMNVKQNIGEAGLVGTYVNQGGRSVIREGEAQKNSSGFILVDEFSGMTDALKQSYNAQFDTQLLAALDHGHISKSMAGGDIEYDTYFTLWGGVQPVRYELSKGMGRRMCFLLNLPDEELKRTLRRAVWDSKNKRPEPERAKELNEQINAWVQSLNIIENINYDESIFKMYEKLDVEPYEISGYDRIILGYHLAKFGADKDMILDVDDKPLYDMLMRQYQWRKDITKGPDLIQISNLIRVYGEEVGGEVYITRKMLNNSCTQLQMSIEQVQTKLDEMKRYDIIRVEASGVIVLQE